MIKLLKDCILLGCKKSPVVLVWEVHRRVAGLGLLLTVNLPNQYNSRFLRRKKHNMSPTIL
jgi:hypothetical protein